MDLHSFALVWVVGALLFAFILALSGAVDDLDVLSITVMVLAWPIIVALTFAMFLRLAAKAVKEGA